jgi:iron(III) transport system ATP-binding protein
VAQAGTPQELYEQPHSAFVAGFMGEALLFDGTAAADGRVLMGPLSLQSRRPVLAGPVKVAIRPEAWRVEALDTAAPPAGALQGRLVKQAYLGNCLEWTVATDLGEVFVVSPDTRRSWALGQPLALTLQGDQVSVVSAQHA